ncbi:MAG: hypothetical protein M5U34_29880 [Chloroflexi bacterium]|nr:hypothetical protein [Chloroflexota bacterium]
MSKKIASLFVQVVQMSIKSEVMNEKRMVALILALFVLLGIVYALTTPVFEASDELWHYPMIRHLAEGNPLPVQVYDPAQAGPWKQEASQPPSTITWARR